MALFYSKEWWNQKIETWVSIFVAVYFLPFDENTQVIGDGAFLAEGVVVNGRV